MKKMLYGFVMLIAISLAASWFGKKAGTMSAVSSVEQEAISQRAPTGLFNVKWLASRDEVKALRPNVAPETQDTMSEREVFYGRKAKITYYFQRDAILMFIVTFLEPASSETFAATRATLSKEYGSQSNTVASTDEYGSKECSTTNNGRFTIDHCLRFRTIKQEQIIFFREKS